MRIFSYNLQKSEEGEENKLQKQEIHVTASKYIGMLFQDLEELLIMNHFDIKLYSTSAAAPRYLRAKIAFHIRQQSLKWF